MIPGFLQRFLTLNIEYDDIITQQRAQRLLYIVVLMVIISIIWTALISIPGMLNGQFGLRQIFTPITLAAGIIFYWLIQRGHVIWVSRMFIGLIAIPTVFVQVVVPNPSQLTSLILPTILTGILLSRLELFSVAIITSLIALRIPIIDPSNIIEFNDAVVIVLILFGTSVSLATFNSTLENITRGAGDLIRKATKIQQHERLIDDTADSEVIISNAINHLRNTLEYSYIRVVMLNDKQEPTNVYYSSIGVERIAQTTIFNFTSTSAFQVAINTGQPQLVTPQDVGNLSAHLLPASSSGAIIPAQHFNQLVALFDIQTESAETIKPEVVAVLELFIDRIASELIYQQTVTTLRNDIQDQQNIISQQRIQIDNLQSNQTDGIVSDWESYLEQRGLSSVGYDINEKHQVSDLSIGDIPADLRPAFEHGEVMIETIDDAQNVVIPIQFRETVVGVIGFKIPKEIPITDRKLEFIRSVTERLALALDNKRLLEQTQIQAQRESTANEIGSVLLGSTDVQSVLQTAVDRFNEALGAVSTRIYLQPQSIQPAKTPQREDAT